MKQCIRHRHTPGLTAHNHFSSSQRQTNKPNYKHQQFLNDLIFSSHDLKRPLPDWHCWPGLTGSPKGVSREDKLDLQDKTGL